MSHRQLHRSPFVGILTAVCGAALLAQPARAADDKAPEQLPLQKVVLFSSGVGFFEHGGDVTGDTKIDFKFKISEINDLLKSMVLRDLGGGKISTVTYGSKDPVTKTLKTFAIDLTSNPTLADLLKQIRGEKIQVEAPNAIQGTIVGVERRKQRVGQKDEVVESDYLNLLTTDGLRSVNLDTVSKLKLLDEKLNGELQQALQILAQAHSTDKKTVTLNFLGNGKRQVRVGYVQESPIWKTSYRLVLSEKDPPFLQGWAIIENTTDLDWKDVNLTLISGRPISFVMDLYQSLYVSRPVVQPELYASLKPQVYGQDLAAKDADFKKLAEESRSMDKAGAGTLVTGATGGFGGGAGGRGGARGPAPGRPDNAPADGRNRADAFADATVEQERLNLQQGIQSVAQAANIGELFQYTIATPVTLPRQASAMLPIVNDSVKGEKLSIYNPNVHAKYPLNGLKLTNSTSLHLMQGPITVFDEGAYAGDARIEDLPPGTERIVSYALDLDTEVAPETKPRPDELVSIKLVKGTLETNNKAVRDTKYTIKNSSKKTKKVLIEYPINTQWKLIDPKEPTEKTRDLYRFAVTAEPGKPTTYNVQEEMTRSQSWAVSNLDSGTILFYVNSKIISAEAKAALQEVIKRKTAIDETVRKWQAMQQQITTVEQEQNRIRQNMAQLDRNSDLYNRYVKMFGEQEDQVQKLRKDILGLQEEERGMRKSLDEYLEKFAA